MEKKHYGLVFVNFLLYYFVLLGERLYSLIMSIKEIGFTEIFLGDSINLYLYGLTIASISVFVFAFLLTLGRVIANGVDKSTKSLSVTAAILMVSGMLGTKYSIFAVQAVAYGLLLLGCLFRCIDISKQIEKKGSPISTFFYLIGVCFSIPVVYVSVGISADFAGIFFLLESAGSIVMICLFTVMLMFLFSEKFQRATSPLFFVVALALAGLLTFLSFGTANMNWITPVAALISFFAFIFAKVSIAKENRHVILD